MLSRKIIILICATLMFGFGILVVSGFTTIQDTRIASSNKLAQSTKTPPLPTVVVTPTIQTSLLTPQSPDVDTIDKIAAQAIQTSNTALELMEWIIGSLIFVSGGIITYFVNAQRSLLDYANGIKNEINEASRKLFSAEQQIAKLSSNYFHLLTELSHQSIVFLPPEMAILAFEEGKIDKNEFRESQIWLAWANWYYGDKEEGFLQLKEYKETSQGLPPSIRRIMIVEIERIQENKKKRGMIYLREEVLLSKLLELLDLKTIDN